MIILPDGRPCLVRSMGSPAARKTISERAQRTRTPTMDHPHLIGTIRLHSQTKGANASDFEGSSILKEESHLVASSDMTRRCAWICNDGFCKVWREVDHLLVYVLHGFGSEMGGLSLGRITYIHVVASQTFSKTRDEFQTNFSCP